jgi:hypothetical protein
MLSADYEELLKICIGATVPVFKILISLRLLVLTGLTQSDRNTPGREDFSLPIEKGSSWADS